MKKINGKISLIKFDDIKTPKTLKEFHKNLRKYFFSGTSKGLFAEPKQIKKVLDYLWVKTDKTYLKQIEISKLKSLFNIKNYFSDGETPLIAPCIHFAKSSLSKYDLRTALSSKLYDDAKIFDYSDKSNDSDTQIAFTKNLNKCFWYKISNSYLRTFYQKTCGEFMFHKKKEQKNDNCSICGEEIDSQGDWNEGHNAEPVTSGRCCTRCNTTTVRGARMAFLLEKQQLSKNDTKSF